jgi:hypothetical protein
LTIENRSPGKVKILWSDAYGEDGHLIVSGILKRRDDSAAPIPAHVHVLVLANDNHIIQSLQTCTLYVPRNKIGHGSDWKRFRVRSTAIPNPGSQLLVTVHTHNESHTDKDLLSSGIGFRRSRSGQRSTGRLRWYM